jgi:hypothetical protein
MDFITINEYFYKIASRLMLVLLLPITAFVLIYILPNENPAEQLLKQDRFVMVVSTVFLLWIFIFYFFNKKIKSIRNDQGLRKKLERYFGLTIVRYTIFSFCSILLSVAFYFSENDLFTGLFLLQLVLCGILWPTSSKVSSDLRLRGDEREMVYYKKDVL